MNNKTDEIIERLEATGFMTAKSYTHDQLLDGMKGFEHVALREVFREGYSDSLRTYHLASHFRDVASQYALCDTEVYGRLSMELNQLIRAISSLVNGARGERYMSRALSWLKCENEILFNVELEYGGERCEYDAIVITPAGIEIVESKFLNHNAVIDSDGFFHDWLRSRERSYNVGEKMRAKEHVLFNTIEAASPGSVPRSCIRSILFAANNNAIVEDHFGLVDVCNSGQLCPVIERRNGQVLQRDARTAAAETITNARQIFLYEPPIDFDQLRSDIADFIVMSERAAARWAATEAHAVEVDDPSDNPSPVNANTPIAEILRDVAKVACCVIGAGAAGYGILHLTRKVA